MTIKQALFGFCCSLILCSTSLSHAEDMQSAIEDYFTQVDQTPHYSFENGDNPDDQYEFSNKILPLLDDFESVDFVSCINSVGGSCLVVHGTDIFRKSITLFHMKNEQILQVEVPIKVQPAHPFLAQGYDGWIVSSYTSGRVFKISVGGTFIELTDLSFDASTHNFEILQNMESIEGYTIGVLVQKDSVMEDRVEEKWVVFDQNQTYRVTAVPEGCTFVAFIQNNFICSWYNNDGDNNLKIYAFNNSNAVSVIDNFNLGQVTLGTSARVYLSGILLGIQKGGHHVVQYLSLDESERLFVVKINRELERIRGEGDLFVKSINHIDNNMLLTKISVAYPEETILVQLQERDKVVGGSESVFATIETVQTGIEFFNPEHIKVERLITEERGVPYTVVSLPGATGTAVGKSIINVYGSYGELLLENYLAEYGRYWLQEGGIYVFAHVRGGGGFGRNWQQAGFGTQKKEAILDMLFVTGDLAKNGYANFGQINLIAQSGGGIVAASLAIKAPAIYGKIALTSPCLVLYDNERSYCTFSNEFGNPTDPDEMAIMRNYSPAHLLRTSKEVIPFLIIQSGHDPIVPTSVTDTFLSARENHDFVRVIQIDSAVHGGGYPAPERAFIAAERLKFFLED
jgi:fermentation-respiration switch protein FrsA (DUF1100 family)